MKTLYLAAVTVGLPLVVGVAIALNLLHHALATAWTPAGPEQQGSPDA